MKKKLSTFKKLVILFVSILIILAGYNLVWFIIKYSPYHNYCASMPSNKNEGNNSYSYKDDNFTYTVKMPAYLGFGGGFLNVASNEPAKIILNEDTDNTSVEKNVSINLFAWPKFRKETQYGVMIIEGQMMTQLYINEHLDYISFDYETSTEIAEHEQILTRYNQQISKLMDAMQIMWGNDL